MHKLQCFVTRSYNRCCCPLIANEMYLLSSVELLFALALNDALDALWFAYLALKSVAVSPTYFSSFSLVFTVA